MAIGGTPSKVLQSGQGQQISFDENDAECDQFQSNPFAKVGWVARKCRNCLRDIQCHSSAAVSLKEQSKAIEALDGLPSKIVQSPVEPTATSASASSVSDSSKPETQHRAALFLGGYKAAVNIEFLERERVQFIVNAAGERLYAFFPAMLGAVKRYEGIGIKVLHLPWDDNAEHQLGWKEVELAVQGVHSSLIKGRSVLVHCAQGKSRSAVVVIAYLMSLHKISYTEALEMVQSKRSMAEPNTSFQSQLLDMTPQLHALKLNV
mmetsp:Transcript_4365/g.5055  ORF Transcript_4365/g.5055 Transcript_4365/m.5055 type:complete len:263 (+) Transcript_4365:176-964(+)